MKTHIKDIRLRNNAGVSFPLCYAGGKLLDMSKTYLPLTSKMAETTCAHCRRMFPKVYPWAKGT